MSGSVRRVSCARGVETSTARKARSNRARITLQSNLSEFDVAATDVPTRVARYSQNIPTEHKILVSRQQLLTLRKGRHGESPGRCSDSRHDARAVRTYVHADTALVRCRRDQ